MCQKLFDNTAEAMKHLGIDEELEMITNVNEIITYGVTVTPAESGGLAERSCLYNIPIIPLESEMWNEPGREVR